MWSSKLEKNRWKTKLMHEPTSISVLSLPDDLLLDCISRVSRLDYRTLSLVSKRFRSLLASPELYKVRSRSGRTESCLYVCFDCYCGSLWFTLSRNPRDGYVLTRVTWNTHSADFPNLVAVGSDIYNIAIPEFLFGTESSRVSIMDFRSHTWRLGPSLPVKLRSLTATVVDQKIYVAGTRIQYINNKSCSENLMTVLDIETETWDHVPIPSCGDWREKSACIDGKFHLVTGLGLVAYEPEEGRWSMVETACGLLRNSYCGIGNILYCGYNEWLLWNDTKARGWSVLKGLVGLPKINSTEFATCSVRLADFGGKLAVLWEEGFSNIDRYLSGDPHKKMICCAVISLERRNNCEIWGEVEWFDSVLDVPGPSRPWRSWKALAVTV